MKVGIWFYLGVPVFIGATMLVASQHLEKRLPPDQRIWFTIPGRNAGRPLTPEESATIQQAIDDIRMPPPSSFTYTDAFFDTHTVSCEDIANGLQNQLDRDAMEAETLNQKVYGSTLLDGEQTTEGDQMNISPELVRQAGLNPMGLTMLKIVLVHEYIHKTQCTHTTTPDEREIEALTAELAYMDSLGMDTTDAFYRATWEAHWAFWYNYVTDTTRSMRYMPLTWTQDHCAYIRFDTTGFEPNYFTSFQLGDMNWYQYALCPTRPGDMMIFDNYSQFPAGHSLALFCGGQAGTEMGRILTLDICQGQVVAPYVTYDFGPPTYPPMFFGSLTRCPWTGTYFVIDTLNKQILSMLDTNQDLIPDTIVSTYASAAAPGFEALMGMRGIDATTRHPLRGFALLVNHDDVHLSHEMDPRQAYWCLPDVDGNLIADSCVRAPMWEFVTFTPRIQAPLPVGGDQAVQLYASWSHDIQVWATDSLGQNLNELLGTMQMTSGVDAECPLSRPLVEGEYILPIDQTTGKRPRLATQVGRGADADDVVPLLPAQFALSAPFPNPFNATTTLRFDLPRAATVTLRIYDVLGRESVTLVSGAKPAGHHTAIWNASDFPSGLYFARLETDGFAQTRKLLLLK